MAEWLRQQASARVISTDEGAEQVCVVASKRAHQSGIWQRQPGMHRAKRVVAEWPEAVPAGAPCPFHASPPPSQLLNEVNKRKEFLYVNLILEA